MKSNPIRGLFLALLALVTLAACSAPKSVTLPTLSPLPATAAATATGAPSLAPSITPSIAPSENPSPTAPPSATTVPSPLPTAVPSATNTAVPSPTALPSATLPPTPVPTTPVPAPAVTQIQFAPGATSAIIAGDLPAGGAVRYSLNIAAGQLVEINVTPQEGLRLALQGQDGTVLLAAGAGKAFFRGHVPSTQDYLLTVSTSGGATSFSLSVVIPARVSFATGATSAVVQGQMSAGRSQYHVLRVNAGQLLELDLAPEAGTKLALYGADGTVLVSGMGDATSFRGKVPSSQDYIVVLSAQSGTVDYTLNVIIPARIRFAAGATSAIIEGRVPAHGRQYYILGAAANQRMQIELMPPEGLRLIVYGVDGAVLQSGMGESPTFDGLLPSKQDYIVVVDAADQPKGYSLSVVIK